MERLDILSRKMKLEHVVPYVYYTMCYSLLIGLVQLLSIHALEFWNNMQKAYLQF